MFTAFTYLVHHMPSLKTQSALAVTGTLRPAELAGREPLVQRPGAALETSRPAGCTLDLVHVMPSAPGSGRVLWGQLGEQALRELQGSESGHGAPLHLQCPLSPTPGRASLPWTYLVAEPFLPGLRLGCHQLRPDMVQTLPYPCWHLASFPPWSLVSPQSDWNLSAFRNLIQPRKSCHLLADDRLLSAPTCQLSPPPSPPCDSRPRCCLLISFWCLLAGASRHF